MVGNKAACEAAAAEGGFDISGAEIIDPDTYEGFDEMVSTMVELRKGKMTAEECAGLLKKSNYFGTMLVKMGKADCLLGGATYSTADTVRPALQLIKTKRARIWSAPAHPGPRLRRGGPEADRHGRLRHQHRLSGHRGQGHRRGQAVCCLQAGRSGGGDRQDRQIFGIDPKVAVLSFSTKGSGKAAPWP